MNTQMKTSLGYSRTKVLKTLLTLTFVLALTVGAVNANDPILTWAPQANGVYDYGTVPIGQTVSQLFTLTNTGGSASAALTVSISGSPMFTVTSDACSATSLGPGKSCGVVVQFDATSSGQLTATLTANGRKPSATANLTLIGTGGAATRHIYWTNPVGAIARADIDGSHVNHTFITGTPYPDAVVVDSQHIYWTTFGGFNTDTIGRADLDGSHVNPNFVTGPADPWGIAVDSQHIYWANGSYTIGRVDVDGSNFNYIHIGMWPFAPLGVAVDSQHIYWTSYVPGSYTIGRADLDGSNVDQNFITGVSGSFAITVDSQHIYWTNSYSNTIGRADLDGSNVNQSFITGASGAGGVAVDSQHIYWTNFSGNTIGRADLDGSNVDQNFITGTLFPLGVAVDSE